MGQLPHLPRPNSATDTGRVSLDTGKWLNWLCFANSSNLLSDFYYTIHQAKLSCANPITLTQIFCGFETGSILTRNTFIYHCPCGLPKYLASPLNKQDAGFETVIYNTCLYRMVHLKGSPGCYTWTPSRTDRNQWQHWILAAVSRCYSWFTAWNRYCRDFSWSVAQWALVTDRHMLPEMMLQSAFHEKVPAGEGVSALVRYGGKVYWWVD
jgi:hypothetical protein